MSMGKGSGEGNREAMSVAGSKREEILEVLNNLRETENIEFYPTEEILPEHRYLVLRASYMDFRDHAYTEGFKSLEEAIDFCNKLTERDEEAYIRGIVDLEAGSLDEAGIKLKQELIVGKQVSLLRAAGAE